MCTVLQQHTAVQCSVVCDYIPVLKWRLASGYCTSSQLDHNSHRLEALKPVTVSVTVAVTVTVTVTVTVALAVTFISSQLNHNNHKLETLKLI